MLVVLIADMDVLMIVQLNGCLYVLQATMPQLTRESLRPCLQRDGITLLPKIAVTSPVRNSSRLIP
jgi:hypothetical protein